MPSPKRILVTGGAGFLGSHLTEALLKEGHTVFVVDNLWTGRKRNLAPLLERYGERLVFLPQDVREMDFSQEVQEIYNLACPASPPYYQQDPVATTQTCVMGALKVLELADRWHARVLQASTSEVYGDALQHPQTEEYWGHVNPHGPRACYDEGKRVAESLFFDYRRTRGTSIKVARIFNSYGPQMDPQDGRVVSNFILQALRQEPLTLYGDGSQTRSFCYCLDTIRGLMALMASPEEFTGPVNIGNPGEFTIRELAEKVLALTGSASPLAYRPLPVDDPKVRRPDISLARKALQWEPRLSLDQGLPPTIQYFQSLLDSSRSSTP
ncbi:MAG: UDP-glucuronic acid decarboxylase family protein [Oligosphaeraceae bacterium]